jgi:HK97 gp10 family phage protein
MSTKVKIEGLRALRNSLLDLPKATSKNVQKRVLIKRAQPLVQKAKDNVPVDFGDLKNSIAASPKLSRRQKRTHKKETKTQVDIFVGPGTHPQAHWMEFGTGERRQRKSGKSVGAVPRVPFMRPAWDATKMGILDGIKEDLANEIEKAAARLAKKANKR